MNFYINRKEKIILTAIEILDKLGFQGLSIKEICRKEEISEGTLYKHFKSKNEIILDVLDFYSKYDHDIKQTIEVKNLSSKESIKCFILWFAEYYENYPAITAIPFSYEILLHEESIGYRIKEIFKFRNHYIMHLIEKGVEKGEFCYNMDSEALANIILGSFRIIVLKWRIENHGFCLKERLLSTLDMILKAY